MDQLLSPAKAGERIGRSRWHIYDLINAGKLPRRLGGKNGNRYVLTESDLQAYLASIETPLPQRGTAA